MKKIKIRTIVQIVFFLLIAVFSINHTLNESGKNIGFLPDVSLHAICPFGGVETFFSMVTLGVLVKKIHMSAVVMMWIIFALTILFGPVFCGWICPLGSIQEWVGKIGKKIFKKRYNTFVPEKLDRVLRYLRYGVLVYVIYVTAKSLDLVFAEYDPYYALFKFWTTEAYIGGIIVLGVTFLASLFIERPWCKYFCPYGALLGISNLFRTFKIRRKDTKCISCNKCDEVCPMNIKVSDKKVVRDHQCISCYECTSENSCPVNDTVIMAVKGEKKNEN